MSGVFDRLHKKMDLEKKDEGISPLDLADLPLELRKIMRFMLREYEISHNELIEAIDDMEDVDLKDEQLEEALKNLGVQGWIIIRGEGERRNYQANLRRKSGTALAGGVWAALNARLIQHGPDSGEVEEKPADTPQSQEE